MSKQGTIPREGPSEATTAALRSASRIEDPAAGWAEEQSFLELPGGRMFVTLVEPLGDARRDVGFLACHSFAWEQYELWPLERTLARAAAARGFPALLFHARGYGDSGGRFEDAMPVAQVRDAVAAAAFLAERAGVGGVVPVGARFGAAVAALAAGAVGAPGLAVWDPALEPRRYLRGLLRALPAARVMAGGEHRAPPVLGGSQADGETADLFGYPLTAAFARSIESLRLLDGGEPVPARVLVVCVNPTRRSGGLRVAERLRGLGADARLEEAEGPGRSEFALGVPIGGHLARRLPLFEDVADRTVRWAEEAW